MLVRIKRVIERERNKLPGTSASVLILNRLIQIVKEKAERFYIVLRKDSTFTSKKDLFMCSLFPEKVLDIVTTEVKPLSVLDVGCGIGLSLQYYLSKGIDAVGIENSNIAISQSGVKEKIVKYNLNKELNLNRIFDLVWCFEVIEHIHPDYETAFLKTLTNHSSNILISAAKPGQGGHGHFNEQLPGYWISKFKQLGYQYDERFTEKLKATNETHCENLLFFKRV
ncbi:MAG: class I SAM-dependent methyltransferase [Chitinophagaceae bacterium]|nr:class I SAM-dependent methyltransferase [Chitinophagaceae bacterium]